MLHKKLVLFDVDGTLAKSKTPMTDEMAHALSELLEHRHVGIISGGKWEILKENIVDRFPEHAKALLHKFHVLPTSGARYHAYKDNDWVEVYAHLFEESESKMIMELLTRASEGEYERPEIYGELVENRETMICLSLLGQKAPLSLKQVADKDHVIRARIVQKIIPFLSEYEVRIAGTTSIDVNKKGMDKSFGVNTIASHLGLSLDEIGFVGDALFPGGNDYPVKELGVDVIEVKNEEETLAHINKWLQAARG